MINDSIESNGGTWEYFKDLESGQIELHYYRPDDDGPCIRT